MIIKLQLKNVMKKYIVHNFSFYIHKKKYNKILIIKIISHYQRRDKIVFLS